MSEERELSRSGPDSPDGDAKTSDARTGDGADAGPQVSGATDRPENHQSVPGVDECLSGIAHLPGLIVLKVLQSPAAKAILACFQAILQQHERSSRNATGGNGLSDAALDSLLQMQPEVLSLIEPLLTAEQVEIVMRNFSSGK